MGAASIHLQSQLWREGSLRGPQFCSAGSEQGPLGRALPQPFWAWAAQKAGSRARATLPTPSFGEGGYRE